MNKTIKGILIVAALFTAMHSIALATTADNTKYRPYKHNYPQIIQADDYETIQFIEAFFTALSKLGNEGVNCAVDRHNLTFTSKNNLERKIIIRQSDSKTILIDKKRFANRNTVILYSTIVKIMSDISKKGGCSAVEFSQFPTRAYKKRTIIEFNCGARVLVIDSFSNGTKNDERLYVLDLVDPKESYLWGKIE